MRRLLLIGALGLIPIVAASTFGQERDRAQGGAGAGRGISGGVGVVAPASSTSGSGAASISSRSSGMSPGSSIGREPTIIRTPSLQGTSFVSLNSYLQAQDFFYYLQTRYMMNDWYFGRFYRNTEPLITPQLLRITMREPVNLSGQMVKAMDDLNTLVEAAQTGHAVNKGEISAKAEEIRTLAKRIRRDNSVAYFDQRQDKDILKGTGYNQMGLKAVTQLNELVTELHTQLKSMYSQTSTSSVSVQTLTQPSFESLSKAIERLSRVVGNSAQRL